MQRRLHRFYHQLHHNVAYAGITPVKHRRSLKEAKSQRLVYSLVLALSDRLYNLMLTFCSTEILDDSFKENDDTIQR